MEKEHTRLSILMFPWLAHSHVYPFLELAKSLSKRSFDIHFCSSAINLASIRNDVEKGSSSDASIDLVELHLPTLPELPPHHHTTKNLPPNLLPILFQAFHESSSSFSEILKTLRPDLLIYDFFQPWAAKLAVSQGIPSVYFATSGAARFSFLCHLHTYGNSSTFPYQEICSPDHEKVEPKAKYAVEDLVFENFKLSCDIALIKSSRGVEGKYIDYLCELCRKKVVPTGPLVRVSIDRIDEENSEILHWLIKKDRISTVFICFGSELFLSKEQILEISKGLELCEANFIWVLRFPVEENAISMEDALPAGFLDRVKTRGLVVQGWAPQAKILSNPSVGCFMSHCGWSSVMESVYFGVPIIAMPFKYDQPVNARVVVEAGAGVEVERDENGVFAGEDVAKAIDKVLKEKTGEVLRERTKDLSEKIRKEDKEAVDGTAEQVLLLCNKSKQQA